MANDVVIGPNGMDVYPCHVRTRPDRNGNVTAYTFMVEAISEHEAYGKAVAIVNIWLKNSAKNQEIQRVSVGCRRICTVEEFSENTNF